MIRRWKLRNLGPYEEEVIGPVTGNAIHSGDFIEVAEVIPMREALEQIVRMAPEDEDLSHGDGGWEMGQELRYLLAQFQDE